MSNVQLKAVRKQFGDLETIHGIDLDIASGEFAVFVGPSGCGKSTLLRMIAGLETVSSGSIAIGGRDVTHAEPSARKVAMVFQSYALYPHMSVKENITFGMRMRGVDAKTIEERLDMAVEILRLEPYLVRKPGALSGGQAQRVAIGRALVQDPDVFLFDEPLSNLDAELRLSTRIEIAALHKRLGKTMIYVTHDQVEAMTLADKIVVLRAGNIEQVGAPLSLYEAPANKFVAGFIGSPAMNFLPARLRRDSSGTVFAEALGMGPIALSSDALPEGHAELEVTIGVRPEHWQMVAGGALTASVVAIERLGATSYLYADLAGHRVCVEARGEVSARVGESISLLVAPALVRCFGPDGAALGRR